MDVKNLREYQKKQLALIIKIDEICKNLNLRYYLIGGTLLGAVRHSGFIPWDFDMDIAMPRNDYEMFKNYWKTNFDDTFFYQDYETEKNHASPHALLKLTNTKINYNFSVAYKTKHNGLYIDIFPLDEPPTNYTEQKKQAKKIKRIKKIIELKMAFSYDNCKIKKMIKRIISFIFAPISFHYLNKKLHQVMTTYNNGESLYFVSMASHYSYTKQLMKKEVYGNPCLLKFEGLDLCCPERYKDYLEKLFGKYMDLPPEKDRYIGLSFIKDVEFIDGVENE